MARANRLPLKTDKTLRKGLERRRKRRVARKFKQFVRLVMGCVLAYGIYWLWSSPAWEWHGQLHVTGNRLVSQKAILARLNVPENTPLYKLNPDWIASQIQSIPAVSTVAVRRWLFPARLELVVLERQALVPVVGGAADTRWMDQEGVIFETPARLMHPQFPVVFETSLQPGERIPEDMRAGLFELLTTWPKGEQGHVDMRQLKDVYADLGGWPVRLGEIKDVGVKFAMLDHLKPLAQKYKDKLEYIDLRFPTSPTFKLKGGDEVDAKKGAGDPRAPGATASGATPVAEPREDALPSARPSAKPSSPSSAPSAPPRPKATGRPEKKASAP